MTIHLRHLRPQPSTLDAQARTVEAIVSTGADAPRPGFIERLDLAGCDVSRLVGAPVLDAHRAASTADQLGVIEAAELRPEGLWVKMRFRSNEAARSVLSDIGDGTLRGLSIGYHVADWQDTREGDHRIRTAIRWTPIEVSIVPVPADPGAHFRAGEQNMPEDQIEDVIDEAATEAEVPEARMTEALGASVAATIAAAAGLDRAWAEAQVAEGTPTEEVRARALDAVRTRSAQPRTIRAQIGMDHTDPAVIATRAGEALYARMHPEHRLSASAREFAHMSVLDHARASLRRSGRSVTGVSADQVITRALHTTSDFPLILGDQVGRELRRSYEEAPSGARQLARQGTIRDFRPKRSLMLGEAPMLEAVGESGEFRHGTFEESQEHYSLATFGKIFAISRQAMINDDLDAFSAIPARLGAAARAFEAAQLVTKIMANPLMSDGASVFDADNHGNAKNTTGTIKGDLAAARLAMRKQTGLSGGLIDVTPRYVLAPPELETELEQELSDIQATRTSDTNPFSALSLIIEPRLTSATTWYVVADPAKVDGLEYSYLEGAPGPQLDTKVGFEVDGVQMKVRLDFGSGWLDHRGWFRVG
ncbi:peptidase U35, phage prohead HK97 [Ketogulonicigenium robustum]|uniref:Peptidase U35, phage prohead HK97 n=1 Tax=Ketogulonicigenium robustum TaxID=92947 RepID=A0A1W6NVU1_9RHOB|nr:prohead protease/major capsid protein fusion protein [Ketogulonicigenium robustum]ARO13366.1 peptidase U35, phage prohead HK97 [Ketogulonicigenium robustum]